jgi:hypothetical protein
MEEKQRKELIKKIIEEQDIVALYTYDGFNKSLGIMQEYSKGILYSGLKKFILQNSEMLKKFTTKNLYTLLASTYDESEKQMINEQIAERLKKEEFFCEDIDSEVFLHPIHTYDSYGKIDKDVRNKINIELEKQLKELGKEYEIIDKNIKNYPDAANFLKYYKDGIFNNDKIAMINKFIEKDSKALEYMNFGIFKDNIFEIGSEFCEYISKFPTISYQLIFLEEKSPEIFKKISERFKNYNDIKENLDEIEVLITYCARNAFDLKEKNIEIEDLLECAYRNSNEFKLINVECGEGYKKRLNQELDKQYTNAKDIKEKLNIYMNKKYSLSLSGAKDLLKDFGTDIENLELSEETKKLFLELGEIVNLEDEKEIDRLFKENEMTYSTIQVKKIKNEIAKECAKDFSKEFNNTDEKIKNKIKNNENVANIEYKGKKIPCVKLKENFNLLVHSTDAEFVNTKNSVENFAEDWSSGKDKKNHIISTTYINQDFLGMAPVAKNGVRYAFSNLEKSKLKLMGVTDLNTYSNSFAYDSVKRQYMSSKTLVYNSRRVYSEFGIEREGTIPDYVVICDDDLPEVIENSYKAASQFEISIIYINKAEIEKEQIKNLEDMLGKFRNTKDTEVLHKLINTYETNMAGWLLNRSDEIQDDKSHTANVDNTRFKEDFKQIQSQIEDTVKEYFKESKENKISDNKISEIISILLDEIELYEGCEETKPISKTRVSFNVQELLQEANKTLDDIGKSELKVDLDAKMTSKQYKKKIQEFVKNALNGEELITTEYKNDTEKIINTLKEKSKFQEMQKN